MKDQAVEIEKLQGAAIEALRPLVDLFVQSHPCLSFKENRWSVFRSWLADSLNSVDSLCLTAKCGGRIVGFIAADIRPNGPLLSPERIGHVSILVVDANFRCRGTGESLWKAVQEWFISRDIYCFELFTESGNELSGPFWRKRGFEIFLEKRRRVLQP